MPSFYREAYLIRAQDAVGKTQRFACVAALGSEQLYSTGRGFTFRDFSVVDQAKIFSSTPAYRGFVSGSLRSRPAFYRTQFFALRKSFTPLDVSFRWSFFSADWPVAPTKRCRIARSKGQEVTTIGRTFLEKTGEVDVGGSILETDKKTITPTRTDQLNDYTVGPRDYAQIWKPDRIVIAGKKFALSSKTSTLVYNVILEPGETATTGAGLAWSIGSKASGTGTLVLVSGRNYTMTFAADPTAGGTITLYYGAALNTMQEKTVRVASRGANNVVLDSVQFDTDGYVYRIFIRQFSYLSLDLPRFVMGKVMSDTNLELGNFVAPFEISQTGGCLLAFDNQWSLPRYHYHRIDSTMISSVATVGPFRWSPQHEAFVPSVGYPEGLKGLYFWKVDQSDPWLSTTWIQSLLSGRIAPRLKESGVMIRARILGGLSDWFDVAYIGNYGYLSRDPRRSRSNRSYDGLGEGRRYYEQAVVIPSETTPTPTEDVYLEFSIVYSHVGQSGGAQSNGYTDHTVHPQNSYYDYGPYDGRIVQPYGTSGITQSNQTLMTNTLRNLFNGTSAVLGYSQKFSTANETDLDFIDGIIRIDPSDSLAYFCRVHDGTGWLGFVGYNATTKRVFRKDLMKDLPATSWVVYTHHNLQADRTAFLSTNVAPPFVQLTKIDDHTGSIDLSTSLVPLSVGTKMMGYRLQISRSSSFAGYYRPEKHEIRTTAFYRSLQQYYDFDERDVISFSSLKALDTASFGSGSNIAIGVPAIGECFRINSVLKNLPGSTSIRIKLDGSRDDVFRKVQFENGRWDEANKILWDMNEVGEQAGDTGELPRQERHSAPFALTNAVNGSLKVTFTKGPNNLNLQTFDPVFLISGQNISVTDPVTLATKVWTVTGYKFPTSIVSDGQSIIEGSIEGEITQADHWDQLTGSGDWISNGYPIIATLTRGRVFPGLTYNAEDRKLTGLISYVHEAGDRLLPLLPTTLPAIPNQRIVDWDANSVTIYPGFGDDDLEAVKVVVFPRATQRLAAYTRVDEFDGTTRTAAFTTSTNPDWMQWYIKEIEIQFSGWNGNGWNTLNGTYTIPYSGGTLVVGPPLISCTIRWPAIDYRPDSSISGGGSRVFDRDCDFIIELTLTKSPKTLTLKGFMVGKVEAPIVFENDSPINLGTANAPTTYGTAIISKITKTPY